MREVAGSAPGLDFYDIIGREIKKILDVDLRCLVHSRKMAKRRSTSFDTQGVKPLYVVYSLG
jgi:hypothetical protein